MSEEEIIQEIEKLGLEEEKEKTVKYLLKIVIEGKKDIIQEKEFFLEEKEKEIEELKKVIKMVEIYKSHGIPEDAEMVIMRKDDFLRNTNNEFITKDKIREKIKEIDEDELLQKIDFGQISLAIKVLYELLEE